MITLVDCYKLRIFNVIPRATSQNAFKNINSKILCVNQMVSILRVEAL